MNPYDLVSVVVNGANVLLSIASNAVYLVSQIAALVLPFLP